MLKLRTLLAATLLVQTQCLNRTHVSLVIVCGAGMTKKAMVYFSQETKQLWSASDAKQQQNTGSEAVDGGAMWLPGNVVLELQMLPMVCGSLAARLTLLIITDVYHLYSSGMLGLHAFCFDPSLAHEHFAQLH